MTEETLQAARQADAVARGFRHPDAGDGDEARQADKDSARQAEADRLVRLGRRIDRQKLRAGDPTPGTLSKKQKQSKAAERRRRKAARRKSRK